MIALDTNILVYAHRAESEWNDAAFGVMQRLAEGRAQWAIPWPCLSEFVAIVTHPRIYAPPTPMNKACAQVEAWLEFPSVVLLAEPPKFWSVFRDCLQQGRASGAVAHDARVAAICLAHGVSEIWTADRDFARFKGITARNPLVE